MRSLSTLVRIRKYSSVPRTWHYFGRFSFQSASVRSSWYINCCIVLLVWTYDFLNNDFRLTKKSFLCIIPARYQKKAINAPLKCDVGETGILGLAHAVREESLDGVQNYLEILSRVPPDDLSSWVREVGKQFFSKSCLGMSC